MRRFMLVVVLLVSALGLVASPAHASTMGFNPYKKGSSASYPSSCTATASLTGVQVCWDDYGEKFWVKDTKADGRRSGAMFELRAANGDSQLVGLCYNTLGNGTTAKCDFDFPEGRDIYIWAGTCDAGNPQGCDTQLTWKFSSYKKSHT